MSTSEVSALGASDGLSFAVCGAAVDVCVSSCETRDSSWLRCFFSSPKDTCRRQASGKSYTYYI